MKRCRWLRCLFLLLAISLLQELLAASLASAQEGKNYWIFLVTGKSTQGTEKSEVAKMQAAHLANFGRLHQAGKLFAAGPMGDPEKKMRGIVVATAPNLESLPELFEPDPYVKQGFLTLDPIEMEIAVGTFKKDVDPKSITEYRLVLLEKSMPDGAEIDAKAQTDNVAYCQSIHGIDRLCFAAWLKNDKGLRRGILVFRKVDDGILKSLVDNLPAVKSQSWKATTFPLSMSDGIVQ